MGRESGGRGERCKEGREAMHGAELDRETQQVARQVASLGWWSSPDGLCTETLSPSSQWVRGKRECVCLAPSHLLFPTGSEFTPWVVSPPHFCIATSGLPLWQLLTN